MAKSYEMLTDVCRARRHRVTARRALTEYDIEPTAIKQLAIDSNYVFRITAGDGRKYALRVQRPVAPIVTNRHLQSVTTIDGVPGVPDGQRCVLFEWLPGSAADDRHLERRRSRRRFAAT